MSRGWKVLVLSGLAVAVIILAYYLRTIFMPVIVALLLAYVLNPLVNFLETKKIKRTWSIIGIYTVLTGVLCALVVWAVPAAVSQGHEFVEETFTGEDPKIKRLKPHLEKWLKIDDWDKVQNALKDKLGEHAGAIAKTGGEAAVAVITFATQSIGGFIAVFSFIALVPVYLFFLLQNLNPWWEKVKRCIPRMYRPQVLSTLDKIHKANASFFRGQLMLSAVEGAILFAGLMIFDVRFSLLFGFLYALLSIIPFLGVVVMFVVVETFVLAETGQFGTTFFLVAGLFALIQVLESAFLQPAILGKETGLHPIVIILALLIAGELFGLFGMLIAIPITSTVKILIDDYVWPMFEEVADLTTVRRNPETDPPSPAAQPEAGDKPEAGSPKPEAEE